MKSSARKRLIWTLAASVIVGGLFSRLLLTSSPAIATDTTTTTTSSTTTTLPGTTTTTLPGGTTTSTTSTTTTTTTTLPVSTKITTVVWPKMGSAAVAIPQLSMQASSPRQSRQPIASLTKMMTTWVVLQQFPLAPSQTGPCETVTAADMALYRYDIATEQSVATIAPGERICERTLLRGIFVHSAGDYAQLLAKFTKMSSTRFVAQMNRDAVALGMHHTHYVDETGILNGDVSTAHDQLILTTDLMTTQPIVGSVAALTKVWLPVAGVVGTYTPFLGQDGVVGIKSGYTTPAGGCVAMAINTTLGDTVVTTYVIVLGQHSLNALNIAGQSALDILHSIRPSFARVRTQAGVQLEWIGSPDLVTATVP